MPATDLVCDYVVIGSGAGGGTVAARLAEAGMDVVLLEAGGDPASAGGDRLPCDYDIPAFHPFASENAAMAWNYRVDHYADEATARRDPKWDARGILYPRAGTLGGCTAHNAMILIAPQKRDWNGIAAMPGYEGWSAKAMARYWRKVERCRHRPVWRFLARIGLDPTGHGWNGWLPVERAMPRRAFSDPQMIGLMIDGGIAALRGIPNRLARLLRLLTSAGDPNDRRTNGAEGICYVPLATENHCRSGTRERLLGVAGKTPIRIELNALATRILIGASGRATGVEYRQGERLFRAHVDPSREEGELRTVTARREVILAAGAFNSPQLLMLSGIGPADELAAHGIAPRVDLPVGRNLQDRYEVSVVSRMATPWESLQGARFEADDPIARLWNERRRGMYISNGAALALTRKSDPALAEADLLMMALLARFEGYRDGYSRELITCKDNLSWAVLKARTLNRAGEVGLRSSDARDPPRVCFHYFGEGSDPGGEDLRAVVDGVEFARAAVAPLMRTGLIVEEISPGQAVQGAALEQWVRDNAWGHHASCTCPMGPREAGGVLDSRLNVHGVAGLRVVDASVFPRIPGYFIVSAIYMAAEKAADMILADAAKLRVEDGT